MYPRGSPEGRAQIKAELIAQLMKINPRAGEQLTDAFAEQILQGTLPPMTQEAVMPHLLSTIPNLSEKYWAYDNTDPDTGRR